jgi:Transposase DDE domain
MPQTISNSFFRLLNIPVRLRGVVWWYLLSLCVDGPKRTQNFAAELSKKNKSQFSRLLKEHRALATNNLTELARQVALKQKRTVLVAGTPWSAYVICDATLHARSSRHVQNAQSLSHGEGWVVGHQWTNIILVIADRVIPLVPIAFYSKKECKRRKIKYQTEHDRLAKYLSELNLTEYLGLHTASEVLVLMDSGYDDKRLQNLITERGWDFLTALKRNRAVKTEKEFQTKGTKARQVDTLFRAVKKQSPWETVRVKTAGGKKRRTFRARQLSGHLRGVSSAVTVVCSEKYDKKGRRFFACSNTKVSLGAIVRTYTQRWLVELFHRTCKSNLGMEHAGVIEFDSLVSHVHWVYCAFLLLHEINAKKRESIPDCQRSLSKAVRAVPFKKIRQLATQSGSKAKLKAQCELALRDLDAA